MVDVVNGLIGASDAVLAQIGAEADDPNELMSVVSVAQMNTIAPSLIGLIFENEAFYRNYIDSNPGEFSSPATQAEVQSMIANVNAAVVISNNVLAQVGNEADENNLVPSVVTVAQLEDILPAFRGLDSSKEDFYQSFIDENPALFSSPATKSEVQSMVDIIQLLAEIGQDANDGLSDGGSSIPVDSTAINAIPFVGGAVDENLDEYQSYINENIGGMSNPATVNEVQTMIASINLLVAIGVDADAGNNTNTQDLNAQQLNALPQVSGALVAGEAAYRGYIATTNEGFSEVATLSEIQAMIDQINLLVFIGVDSANGNNANTATLTASQLSTINGIEGVEENNINLYLLAIASNEGPFSSVATIEELQDMVDRINQLNELPENNIIGSSNDDNINGSSQRDYITASAGDDTVNGLDGDDFINGGEGDDNLNGGDGNDTIEGAEGNDQISGGSGNDNIHGAADDDLIDGGSGDDNINGGDGNDQLSGGEGSDRIDGGEGDNRVSGGEGIDSIVMNYATEDVVQFERNANGIITFIMTTESIYRVDTVEFYEFLDRTVAENELESVFLEQSVDTNNDGVSDYVAVSTCGATDCIDLTQDSDGDGVPDQIERFEGSDPNDANSFLDSDGDRIPSFIENAMYGKQDLNNDGIRDGNQSNVASSVNAVTGEFSALASSGACESISRKVFVAEDALSSENDTLDFPLGLVDFELACQKGSVVEVGGSATVTIYYDKVYDTTDWVFTKFDKDGNTYADISDLVTYSVVVREGINILAVTYTVTDGDPRTDSDGIANGIILDPAGPGIPSNGKLEESSGDDEKELTVSAGSADLFMYLILLLGGLVRFRSTSPRAQ